MNLNGNIMSKDKVVARVENGLIVDFDAKLLPLYLLKTKDVAQWLSDRAIDSHRTNSRLLKRALRLSNADDLDVVLRVHATTITDTYWFKKDGEELSYNDVRFKENQFDKLALCGDPDSFDKAYCPTPELTNIGSYEKCWRLIDERWWMVKSGNENELFSELFFYHFGKRLGFNMAVYEPEDKYVKSIDFTDGASVNFESAAGLVLGNEDYSFNFRVFAEISEAIAKQYVEMLYIDTLCNNMDRHTQNYGVLRDIESGEILSFAPLFDHNIALIARGMPSLDRKNNKLIGLFIDFLNSTPEAMRIFHNLELPPVDEEMIRQCCEEIPIKTDTDFICRYILNGEQGIQEETVS